VPAATRHPKTTAHPMKKSVIRDDLVMIMGDHGG
jgi:hypothetical protein